MAHNRHRKLSAVGSSAARTILGPLVLFAAAALHAGAALAHSAGSPVCSVDSAPISEHGGAAIAPGRSINVSSGTYTPGSLLTVRIVNTNSSRTTKGVLLWAKRSSDGAFVGSWSVPSMNFQLVSGCSNASLAHASNTTKTQTALQFSYTAPAQGVGAITFRAYLVEGLGSEALTAPVSVAQSAPRRDFDFDGDILWRNTSSVIYFTAPQWCRAYRGDRGISWPGQWTAR
jgi:hypothetical protein